MTDKEYLPVTEAAAVENKISNSVKISKQLMRSELKKRIATDEEKVRELDINQSAVSGLVDEFIKALITPEVKRNINADSEFTRFRNIFNKFSTIDAEDLGSEYFSTNSKMIRNIETGHVRACLLGRGLVFGAAFPEDHKLFVEHQIVTVPVELGVRDYDEGGYHSDSYLGYEIGIPAPKELLDIVETYQKATADHKEALSALDAMREKLEGIDQVAEQMEAQLLVQELSKSDEGKLALQTAGDLVGDMLGETPDLLRLGE